MSVPSCLQIESTNRCNFNCITCDRTHQDRPECDLPLEDFKRIIDQFPRGQIQNVVLQGWGEPLLHPQIFEMVKYLNEKGVSQHFNTNGSLVYGENVNRIFDSNLSSIAFSLDELDKTTIRIGTSSNVYENLKALIAEKKRRGRTNPTVVVDMTISQLNVNQAEPLLRWSEQIGVDVFNVHGFFRYPRVLEHHPQVKVLTEAEMRRVQDVLSKAKIKTVFAFSQNADHCHYLYEGGLYVDSDGKVYACCHFHSEEQMLAPNPFSLLEVWRGRRLNDWRMKHLANPLCRHCLGRSS